ncbi:MAG: molybdate ABC transporter substrate-binding protein [Alphaproteobacteria bacterium]|nr:molybdate ABC transporter substrate-binding protein [Alphaproteobacteria bacterium]
MTMHKILFLLVFILSAKTAIAAAPQTEDPVSFTVLAETQLVLPLTEITRKYSLQRGITMLTAFEDSPSQAQKLLEGESGDVIITSYPAVAADLKQRGMIDVYSLATIASDKLVLAAKQNDERDDRRELLNALEHQAVLLADPKRYVEGLYGQQTLQYLYYDKPLPVPPTFYYSRNAMYEAIRNGNGIGILLDSEAHHIKGIDLMVPLAESSYPPITYQSLIVAGENMPIARDFTEYLRGNEAQEIFQHYGFTQP